MRFRFVIFLAWMLGLVGCGTTRWTDTSRTATEQLLISDAIDRSVSRIDFEPLAGQSVFLDTSYLNGVTDKDYLISTLRQHMLASGCSMELERDKADFVVEARAGAVGTDRHDLLYGIPALNLPVAPVQGMPTATPEIAFARRTDQKAVAKVAVFAYHRESGKPVWQSGADTIASQAQNSWLLGMGPLKRGTIYDKAQFAGQEFRFPLLSRKKEPLRTVRVTRETQFNNPQTLMAGRDGDPERFGESLRLALRDDEEAESFTPPGPTVNEWMNSPVWKRSLGQPGEILGFDELESSAAPETPPSGPPLSGAVSEAGVASPAAPSAAAAEAPPSAKLIGPSTSENP